MALNASDYAVNYDDERLQNIKTETDQDIAEVTGTYNDMINSSQGFYDDLKNTMQEQADKQAQIQQDNTDFAIEKIEQQKEQAQKDYIKEQSGAYVDWQKQSNQYGAEAEKMASAGLANTGYSESSQVSMYNTYQNRVATARDALERAKLNYDNNIQEAMLQNNAALAEIYSNLAIEQAKLSLEGFQYKNQLVLELADKKTELKNIGWQKQMDMLNQLNTENALKWEIDSYKDNQAWQTKQNEIQREFEAQENLLDRQHQEKINKINNDFEAEQNRLEREFQKELESIRDANERERLKIQHQNEMAKLKQQQQYALAQLDKELANEKELLRYQNSLKQSQITGGSSSGSSNVKKYASTVNNTTNKMKAAVSGNKGTTSQPTPNMQSLIDCGLATRSASYVNNLVKEGKLKETVKNGQIYYSWSPVLPTSTLKKGIYGM